MHTRNAALMFCALSLLFLSGSGMLASLVDEREQTRTALENTISLASDSYRERTNAGALKSFQEKTLKELQDKLTELGKEKQDARDSLESAKRQVASMQGTQSDLLENERMSAAHGVGEADQKMETILRENYLSAPLSESPFIAALHRLTEKPSTDVPVTLSMLASAHVTLAKQTSEHTIDVLRLAMDASGAVASADTLQKQLEDLQTQYLEASTLADRAQNGLLISDKVLASAKVTAAEVHKNVLAIQAHLATIDTQLRHTSEDSLVQMGLLSAAPADAPVDTSSVKFIWPVTGPLASGFHDALYFKYFGIPHMGQDIMVPQLTPVKSAADGIVFLVKDGGLTGYTYVLIGHRDGIATLYGHLNVVQVAPGQEVHAGDIIGLSGGTPGTAGAGLITTGAHLHFEVIVNGVNVDPLTVLPKTQG